MNIYSIFPLIAVIAYIPLLITTASTRPWQKRHTLFFLFLISAMLWSLFDYIFRSHLLVQHSELLFKLIVIFYTLMAIRFHCFVSSFFAPGQGRWIPFAYASLLITIILVITGYVTKGVVIDGDVVHGSYGIGVIFIFASLIILGTRDFYVLGKRLSGINDPVMINQITTLIITISVVILFTFTAFIPQGKDYPLGHLGNIINAFLLSYAVIRHRLVDIRFVIRQGTSWFSLAVIGGFSFWVILMILRNVLHLEMELFATVLATIVGLVVAGFIFRLRNSLFELTTRFFQGSTYDHRLRLYTFANTIQNVFSLKKQGDELLTLLTKAIGIRQASLLFPDASSGNYVTQLSEPKSRDNKITDLVIREGNPILKYLERERDVLLKEKLDVMPEFLGLWAKERADLKARDIEMFIPLISRERLVAVLAVGKKQGGKYSLEDLRVLEAVTNKVAVSIEKEYLSEQLREREQELSVINRCSAIVASSLDIQEIYESFIEELKNVIDVSWAAIVLAEESGLCFIAMSSKINADAELGKWLQLKGTATEWIIAHKETMYLPNIDEGKKFVNFDRYFQWGLRSIVFVPLIAKGEIVGSFIVASRQPDAYNQHNIGLLEQLASQISMPVENARLYARVEEKARIDELTGLLNRRSLDEAIENEIVRHSRYGGVFSLAIIDLDSFKPFNDTYGHLAGDKLLRQVGRVIKGAVRGSDLAFRYGGDEFAILMPQTTLDAANHVAQRVRERIAKKSGDGSARITASIGLSSWPADGISQNAIIAAADVTLYRAKKGGGNQNVSTSGNLLSLDTVKADPTLSVDERVLSTIFTMADNINARNSLTRAHSKKVIECTLTLGKALGLNMMEMEKLETCALLHDIGKISISDDILNKMPWELTVEESESIKIHPQMGATIVTRVPKLAYCAPAILHHHERYDGAGYPSGLQGEAIPVESRILAIADAFATFILSEQDQSVDSTMRNALKKIKQESGSRFDPNIVSKLLAVYSSDIVRQEKIVRR